MCDRAFRLREDLDDGVPRSGRNGVAKKKKKKKKKSGIGVEGRYPLVST